QGILIDENMAFVANSGYSGWGIPYAQATISVIDTRSDSVIHTINVPMNAQDVAIDPLGRIHTLCTGDYYSSFGCVAVIDMHSGPNRNTPAVVDTIIIGGSPSDIAITENGKAYCIDWGNETHGYLYSYDALNHTAMHTALNPILVGPNVSRLAYDAVENVLWIPTMNIYGGDGSLQKFDAVSDSIVWKSAVIGSGSYDLAILEPIEGPFIGIDDESDLAGVPAIELAQNYPNPFNPHTRITFTITDEQYLELSVYNQLGQITKNLSAGTIAAGTHVATWDGTNDEGMPVSSGIYFYQLKTYSSVISRRMILLR
ncbi:T9SS type A sorting domain-containing protein, partial [candidate division KSB1 bacterium]|nr:T9SS type A sorting domain-containing protein [candidate division KSB1 bacterium]